MMVALALLAFLAAAMKFAALFLGLSELALALSIAGVDAFWIATLAFGRRRGLSVRELRTIVSGAIAFGLVLMLITLGLAWIWTRFGPPRTDILSATEAATLFAGLVAVSFVGFVSSAALWPTRAVQS